MRAAGWRIGLGAALLAGAALANATEVPDPTRPRASTAGGAEAGGAPAEEEGGLALQSVLVRGDKRRAVINGRPVVEGERIGGYRVRSIGSRRVVLEGPEGQRVLRMGGEGLQKRKVAPQ